MKMQPGLIVGLIVGVALISGCRSSQSGDAVLLAQRGSDTTGMLSNFYGSLASDCRKEPQMFQLSVDQPLAADDPMVKTYQGLADEFAKRQKVSHALQDTYKAFGKLASGQSADLDKSLAGLQSAVVALNDNHSFNISRGDETLPAATVTADENKLASFVIDLRRQPDLRRSNDDLEGVVSELSLIFGVEESSYRSVAEDNVHESYQLARNMARAGAATGADTLQSYVGGTGIRVLPKPMTGSVLTTWINVSKIREAAAVARVDDRQQAIRQAVADLETFHQQFHRHAKLVTPDAN